MGQMENLQNANKLKSTEPEQKVEKIRDLVPVAGREGLLFSEIKINSGYHK